MEPQTVCGATHQQGEEHNTDDGVEIPNIDISVFFNEYYHKEIHEPIHISTMQTMPVEISKELINSIFLPTKIITQNDMSIDARVQPIHPNAIHIAPPIGYEHFTRIGRKYNCKPIEKIDNQQLDSVERQDATQEIPISPTKNIQSIIRNSRVKSRIHRKKCIQRSIIAMTRKRSPNGSFLSRANEFSHILPQELELIDQKYEMKRETRTYDLCADVKIKTSYNAYTKQGITCGLFIKECHTIKDYPIRIERTTKSRTTRNDSINETILENYIEYRTTIEVKDTKRKTRQITPKEPTLKVFKVEVITSMYFL